MEKQTKTIEDQGKKQVEASKVLIPAEPEQKLKSIEGIFPKDLENSEIKNESSKIEKWKKKLTEMILNMKQVNMHMIFGNFIKR